MTPDTRTEPQRSPAAPLGPAPERHRTGPIQIVIIVLLILIPVCYGAVAAVQSYDNDGDKHAKAQTSGIIHGLPSRMQRDLYKVPVPYNVSDAGFLEANSWQVSSLYVQFTTSGGGLDTFLAQYGTSRAALLDGRITVTAAEAHRVGWTFPAGHHWAGADLKAKGSTPSHRIVVDLDNPDRPSVYVVASTVFK
ncbi:hypothetical protein POF50_032175 [Streptomyces sp. SL13]|uniref:Sugar kinase n=1 Tax=Streptantibioticus silvisoli TaxID=2705255 RepID=A0AA90KBP4_9ACTN|nr:hypothetical protein [Streptantibioticus silvisoli]MDI5973948.1 hypothetical protein [Streptantibioticus silvisoli]